MNTNNPEIFDEWALYHKILEKDHMYHSEIFTKICTILNSKFNGKEYNLLDIGCGDAYCIEKYLTNTKLKNYCGIDNSKTALSLAKKNLSNKNIDYFLLNSDFNESMDKINDRFDAILAGYSIHHLKTFDEKKRLLHKFFGKLQNGGIFILFDIIKKNDESLEKYHIRYIKNCKDTWDSIEPKEFEQIANHIKKNDYPLTLENWQNIFFSSPVNLEQIRIDTQNPYYVLLCFQKNRK